jgi:phosphoenolpyruvate-protein kinase (PTS system EI component)
MFMRITALSLTIRNVFKGSSWKQLGFPKGIAQLSALVGIEKTAVAILKQDTTALTGLSEKIERLTRSKTLSRENLQTIIDDDERLQGLKAVEITFESNRILALISKDTDLSKANKLSFLFNKLSYNFSIVAQDLPPENITPETAALERREILIELPTTPVKPQSSKISYGFGNNIFRIAIDRPIIIERFSGSTQRIIKSISAEEVTSEENRLKHIKEKVTGEDIISMIQEDIIKHAVGLVRGGKITIWGIEIQIPHPINAEAALDLAFKTFTEIQLENCKKIQEAIDKLEINIQDLRKQKRSATSIESIEEQIHETEEQANRKEELLGRMKEGIKDCKAAIEGIYRILARIESGIQISIKKGDVIVAESLDVAEIQRFRNEGAAAFILDSKKIGPISHIMIAAHQLGIPIVLIPDILSKINPGDRVTVDSRKGAIIINPSEDANRHSRENLKVYNSLVGFLNKEKYDGRVVALDGTKFYLWAHTQDITDAEKVSESGAKVIGLHRSEIWYMGEEIPTLPKLVRWIKKLADNTDRFVFRLLDVGGDKISPALQASIGNLRGISFLLRTPEGKKILKDQLTACLLAQHGLSRKNKTTKIEVLVPMVTSTDELIQIQNILDETKQELIEEKQITDETTKDLVLSAMVETPAAIVNLDSIAEKVDSFHIGTNDLTVALLSISREELLKGPHADWLNPVVLKGINRILKTGGEISICGEMAREPLSVIVLVILGVRNFSMDPDYIQEINYLLKHLDLSSPEWTQLREEILSAQSAIDVRNIVYQFLQQIDRSETVEVIQRLIPSPFPLGYQSDH